MSTGLYYRVTWDMNNPMLTKYLLHKISITPFGEFRQTIAEGSFDHSQPTDTIDFIPVDEQASTATHDDAPFVEAALALRDAVKKSSSIQDAIIALQKAGFDIVKRSK